MKAFGCLLAIPTALIIWWASVNLPISLMGKQSEPIMGVLIVIVGPFFAFISARFVINYFAEIEHEAEQEFQRIEGQAKADRAHQEKLADESRKREETAKEFERERIRRVEREKQRSDELASLSRLLATASSERKTHEYRKREAAISELLADIRQEKQQHSAFLSDPSNRHMDKTQAYKFHAEEIERIESKIAYIKQEIELIEDSM